MRFQRPGAWWSLDLLSARTHRHASVHALGAVMGILVVVLSACDEGRGRDAATGLDGAARDGAAGDGSVIGTGETMSATVGPEGAVVELTGATLTIPPGALTAPTLITMTETTMPTPAGYRAFSPLYRFEPEGLRFETAVTIAIRSRASGADVPLGTLFWSRDAAEGGGWERIGGVPSGGVVTGEVTHFSFGFIADGVDYTEAPDTSCVRTRVLDTRTLAPSGVGLFFAMDDCWGRPITDLTDANLAIYEDGMALSSEASAQLFEQRGLQVFVTLAIDVSASTRPVQADVIAAARSFVETLNDPARGLRERVQVAIYGFAGEASFGFIQPHTLDLDLVLRQLDALATYEPEDASSTNLHGALRDALSRSQAAQEGFRSRNRGGAFTAGTIALFTDGGDTAGRVSFDDARAALEGSQDDVVALGLRGDDYDPAALRRLVGDWQVYDADSTVVLDRDFRHLAARIAGQVRRSYLLGYCSPRRSGTHTVYAGHRAATEVRIWGEAPSFVADGFSGGCAPDMFDPARVCGAGECGGFGCGACNDRVAACDPIATATRPGACVSHCITANLCSGETITNPQGYEQVCTASPTATLCELVCRDLTTDLANCGSCGAVCPPGIRCEAGRCACPSSAATACGGACVDTLSSVDHCGSCGAACPLGVRCEAGRCACPTESPTVCGGACVDTMSDLQHCGTCDRSCLGCDRGSCINVAAEISAGRVHTCARLASGAAACWGANPFGELGDGTTATARVAPVRVSGITDAVELGAGERHTCARLASGAVTCWGRNEFGQLGDGTTAMRLTAISVSGVDDALEISVGERHTCARRASGAVVCWGSNSAGQLGDGTTSTRLTPVTVSGLTDAVEISASLDHTCARRASGAVVCWGSNGYGQLGEGTTVTTRLYPVMVSGLTDAVEISAGSYLHTCARRATGGVVCWGFNDVGQLGDGSTTMRLIPVPVSGLPDAVEIAAGSFHTCARRASGSVVCWGGNNAGQLGDGTGISRSRPVAVTGLTDAIEITAGGEHTCARRATGPVVCWGQNGSGQLGSGTGSSLTPVTVVGSE